MVCWVAVGGRGRLWGAVLGAIVVNWLRIKVSSQWPDSWLYLQGLLFIAVLAFFPGGIAGLLSQGWEGIRSLAGRRPASATSK